MSTLSAQRPKPKGNYFLVLFPTFGRMLTPQLHLGFDPLDRKGAKDLFSQFQYFNDGCKFMEELDFIFKKEYWTGDSRDGALVDGDGYHFFKMLSHGLIVEAYEFYEHDDGTEVVTPLPEMQNVDWIKDLGFDDLDDLDSIPEKEFTYVRNLRQR